MSAGMGETLPAAGRAIPRWLLITLGILVLVGGFVAVLSKSFGHLITKALTHYAPPDPYRLQAHYAAETTLLAVADDKKSADDWLLAAQFELDDNSPYGASWCLDRAKAGDADAKQVKAFGDKIKLANGRWVAIHNALLSNHRYADGNNVYTDIYPILDRLRAEDTPEELTGKARADLDLLEAHLLLREGRRTEARPILAALAEQPGPLQGLCAYLHAKTWLREADPATARRLFTEYLAKFPGERLNAYAAYELGNLALEAGDQQGAMTWFKDVFTKYDDSPQAHAAQLAMFDIAMGVVPKAAPTSQEASPEESLFDLGAAPEATNEATEPKDGGTPTGASPVLEATKEIESASGLDGRLIPDTVEGWNRYGQLFAMAHDSSDVQRRAITLYKDLILPDPQPLKIWTLLTSSSALGWATALAEGGVEQGAIRLCDWGIKQPGTPDDLVAIARLRGRLLIGQRKFEDARTGLEGARKLLDGKVDLAPIDYELARSWRLDSNAGRSRGWYLKAAASPNPLIAADALAQAAWAAAQSGDWELALTDYRSLIKKFPDSVYAEAAREHLLSDALRRNDRPAAQQFAEHLASHATKGGRHVRGQYCATQLGQSGAMTPEQFFDRYALTYYGTLVSDQMNLSYVDWNPSASDLLFAELRKQESSVAGATFLAGLWDLTDAELDASSPEALSESFALLQRALITASEGVPKHTILDAQSFLDRGGPADVPPGWTDLLLDDAYPLDYLAEVQAEADRYQFPPELLMGIIRQESFFNPKAKSHAGARGLMQLMPPTGNWAAQQVGLGKVQPSDFEKPATNLRLGTWHLDFLRRAGGTSFGLMLAAHNGGPGNLAKWQNRYGGPGVPEWLFLELIPNQESREFVRQVTANQAAYAYLLARDRRQGAF